MSNQIDENLYELLGLTIAATPSDIRSAYKKKALKCHPDKNPDNPKAAQLFHELTKALEVLLDESARAAYDKLLKGKEAAKLRHKALDDKRKKFKEDLEARERAAAGGGVHKTVSEEEKLRHEVKRLQEEGARLVQDEIRLLQEQVLQDLNVVRPTLASSACQLKATWQTDKAYTEDALRRIFSKYGDVEAIAVLPNKAIVEFVDGKAAELAVKCEIGFLENPLKVSYASSKLRKAHRHQRTTLSETLAERNARQYDERQRIIREMQMQDVGLE